MLAYTFIQYKTSYKKALQINVWSKIGDRLKSRRIDFYDLKRVTQKEFTALYNEAWDVQIKSMGITNN